MVETIELAKIELLVIISLVLLTIHWKHFVCSGFQLVMLELSSEIQEVSGRGTVGICQTGLGGTSRESRFPSIISTTLFIGGRSDGED